MAAGLDAKRETLPRWLGRMDYETGALVEIAQRRAIRVHRVADLCWGEIDNHEQYTRVLEKVWPAVRTRDDRVQ